jgi:DNA segregation ATPase FtsK/SpoIIIE, S-DNA-T family
MASERELINEIENHAKALAQIVAEAEYWHRKALESLESERKTGLKEIETEYESSMASAKHSYDESINQIKAEIKELEQNYSLAELSWDAYEWQNYKPNTDKKYVPRVTRLGWMVAKGKYGQIEMPALLPIIGTSNVVIKASGPGKQVARDVMQSIMLRLVATLPPGKMRFTCIDPVGLGSTVAGFIKGLPEFLSGGQSWYDSNHIEQRLADLEAHTAFVKQKYLGVSFSSMEDYNSQAGQIEEPYRLLAIADFPSRFSDSAAQRLMSIATNGPSTGVYTIVMVDMDQTKLPYGFNLSDLERTATVLSCDGSNIVWNDEVFKGCEILPDDIPAPKQFEQIVDTISTAAITSSDVKVSFESLIEFMPAWGDNTSETGVGIRIPIGQFGAKEKQFFALDEKLLSSALIIGKTGSGKSNLLHIIINGLALTYSPEEIELYLLDLKEVEFKDYATYKLPHARVVGINCEREFGLSVLRGLDSELRNRMEIFRGNGLTSLSDFRAKTGQKLPRVVLMVDEFQELFSIDDTLANEAGLILDRLVRQGRAFGINVLLASQTLAGPYTFSSATKNQIPIRIVMQSSDADSRLALSDENDRARLLERPGEAIFNAANGRIEGNNRFQSAWLSDDERESVLNTIYSHAKNLGLLPEQPQIVFEGNAPAQIDNNRELASLLTLDSWPPRKRAYPAWIGEPIEIKTHTAAVFRPQSRSNLLVIGQNEYEQLAVSMLFSSILSLATQIPPDKAQFYILNLSDYEAEWHDIPQLLKISLPHKVSLFERRRDLLQAIDEVAKEVNTRLSVSDEVQWPMLYLVILGLHRARDLRRDDTNYSNHHDPNEPDPPYFQLATISREGPEFGVHTLVWCDTFTNLSRVFERREISEFDIRVALQMGSEESRSLIDSEAATKLGSYRALLFDEERTGRLEKFRPYGLPTSEWITSFGSKLKVRL